MVRLIAGVARGRHTLQESRVFDNKSGQLAALRGKQVSPDVNDRNKLRPANSAGLRAQA